MRLVLVMTSGGAIASSLAADLLFPLFLFYFYPLRKRDFCYTFLRSILLVMKYVFLAILILVIPTAVFWYTQTTPNTITLNPSLASSSNHSVENRFPDLKPKKPEFSGPRSELSTQDPKEGDTALLSLFDPSLVPATSSFMGNPLSFFSYEGHVISFIPIPIGSVGNHELHISFTNGEEMTRVLRVQKKQFPVYNVGIPKKLGLTAPELIQKLAEEKKNLDSILGLQTKEAYFSRPFIFPVGDAPISGTFGEIRKTGKDEIRHLGVDFAPPDGTSVHASNDGVIEKAGLDDLYGNMVIIDHGRGIFSLYLHMKLVSVKIGNKVKRGDVIGIVGNTGYSTGEHLHLSVKINTVSVDPIAFIKALR